MPDTDPALLRAENRLILQLHRVADAQRRMTKALAVGWCDSELRGAAADLVAAGNEVERIRHELSVCQSIAPKPAPAE